MPKHTARKSPEPEERKPFKDYFGEALVDRLAQRLQKASRRFSSEVFRERATGLEPLEMSGRVGLIADAIKAAFGKTRTADLMAALTASLPPILQTADEPLGQGHQFWPYGELIGRHGLDDVDASFTAMVELTQRFTSEFAVRPFLHQDVDDLLSRMEALVEHPSVHVRRWLSEGTRTRLPWGRKVGSLASRQGRRIALLSRLRHDPERYVQRSVANHLGDILKDDIATGVQVLRTWLDEDHPTLSWICRHAARAPLKDGHPEVLALFGHAPAGVEARAFVATPKKIGVGEAVTLKTTLVHGGDQAATCRIDYALVRPSKIGKPSRKVFRWADRELVPGESVTLETRYAFVPRTIRPVNPGPHSFELIIDGVVGATVSVTVV